MSAQIDPFYAISISGLAHRLKTEGRSIIHMEFGQPSTGAPQAAIAAAHGVLDADGMGYWESAPLKARICRHYAETYGVAVEPMQITLTCGASPALVLALSATFSPGDVIAMARPGYVAYRNTVKALHMVPLEIACGAQARFPAHRRNPGGPRAGSGGRDPGQPGEPHRYDHPRRGPRGHRRGLPRARHPHHLRRDLPRPHLRRADPIDAGVRAAGDRRQQLLQVLQHGRLAARLGDRAA
jgi:hypothetical protein